MHILIISLIFPPEKGSARRVGELAAALAQAGNQVTVVTGFPSYPTGSVFQGYTRKFLQRERWEERMDVYRVFLHVSPKRKQAFHRLAHYLSFTVSSVIGGLLAPRPDIVYVVSPPYFLGFSGWLISLLRGARLVFDVQDFWPEAPIAMGYVKNGLLIKALFGFERFIYNKSKRIFTLSDVMKERIIARGVAAGKIIRVYNWVNFFGLTLESDEALRARLGLRNKFIALFAGNMGLAQGLDNVLRAAKALESQPEVVVVLLGDGIERANLMHLAQEMNLRNVLFLDAVPESEVSSYLSIAHVLLIPLARAKHREGAIPSKIQMYMANRKPMVVAAEGAAAQIVQQAKCGIAVPPEDPAALAQAILCVKDMSPQTRNELGQAGRRFAEENFDYMQQCGRIETHLRQLFNA